MSNLVLSSLGSGGQAKAGAGLLSGGMPSGSSWGMAGLSGLASAASAFSRIGDIQAAGEDAQQAAYMSAQDELLNATQAYVSGRGQVGGLRGQLAAALGSRAAIGAASGVDQGGQGIGQDNNAAISDREMSAEKIATTNAEIEASRHRMNAIAQVMKGNRAGENASRQARATGLAAGVGGALSIAKLLL